MPEAIDPQLDDLRRRARRRLVGAVVLALAAAVLVPMLLESEPRPLGEDVSVKIPPVDDGEFVTKLGEKTRAPEPSPATKPAPPAEPPASVPATATTSAPATQGAPASDKPPAAEKTAPAREASVPAESKPAAPRPAPESPAKSGAFSVQLAAFSDDKGANALANRLKKSGHPAYTEPSLSVPPASSFISAGITGIIIPNPITSMRSVTNMNPSAACFLIAIT